MARRSRIPQYGTVEINGIQYYKTYVEDAEGKRIAIYGKTRNELYDKELEIQELISTNTYQRKTPTVAEYCEKWLLMQSVHVRSTTLNCQRHFKMSIFAEMGCRFLQGSIQVLYSLIHHITCRFEARQALIYQLASGLTGENGKYNYSKAVHLYPPFFDIFCSPKNYKTASALT